MYNIIYRIPTLLPTLQKKKEKNYTKASIENRFFSRWELNCFTMLFTNTMTIEKGNISIQADFHNEFIYCSIRLVVSTHNDI